MTSWKFRNVNTVEHFKRWCNRPEDGFKLREERRIDTTKGVAFIADGSVGDHKVTVYAVGRNENNLSMAFPIIWKDDVPTLLEQRVDHAEKLAREFLAEWRPYNQIAHEFRKHA